MNFVFQIAGIGFGDTFSHLVLWVMMIYLTDVWKLDYTHAAMIINIWKGSVLIFPLAFTYIAETLLGSFPIVLLANLSYMLGLGLLWMSTPPVLSNSYGNCTAYKPQCIGDDQKRLFYSALPLIAMGMASSIASLPQFFLEQLPNAFRDNLRTVNNFVSGSRSCCFTMCSMCLLGLVMCSIPIAGLLVVTFVKSWAIRFGICAIFGVVSALFLLSGVRSYNYAPPVGSPFTTIFRVLIAASSKAFYQRPPDVDQLYERRGRAVGLQQVFHRALVQVPSILRSWQPDFPGFSNRSNSNGGSHGSNSNQITNGTFENVLSELGRDSLLPHTKGLSCLDKAAIIIPGIALEQQEQNRWRLCRVTEVETTKIFIRMIPMWMTFIISGVVSSIGDTYFLEQASKLNPKLGRVKVPLIIFLLFQGLGDKVFTSLFLKISAKFSGAQSEEELSGRRYIPAMGIGVAMVFSILCCITAAMVEERRLQTVRSHDLVNKSDERIPMSVFWLIPQFVLLGAIDGIHRLSVVFINVDQLPPAMITYVHLFSFAVFGAGIMGSVVSVYTVGKVSARVGGKSWFQTTLNQSRLDNYYWVLGALSAINLACYVVVAIFHRYKTPVTNEMTELEDNGDLFGDDRLRLCCCC